MLDAASGKRLDNAIEVHTLELTKYNLSSHTISTATQLEQWVFLLLHAQDYEADELHRLLPGIAFKTAIDTLEIIFAKTQDKRMYDQREKAQRDYEWQLASERTQGLEQGLEQGEEKGRRLEVVKTIHMLQELLHEPMSSAESLAAQSLEILTATVAELRLRLQDRYA